MAVKVQHLRSATASKRPTAANLLAGELSINTNAGTSGVFFKDADGNIIKTGPAEVGGTAPNASPASGGSSGNSTGEFWLDTANSGGNSVQALKVFDGSAWDYIGSVTIGTTNIEVGSSGSTSLAGLTSVETGGLSTTGTTFNLVNANATTVNFAGAATAVEIGAASGVTSVNNDLSVDGVTLLKDDTRIAGDKSLTFGGSIGNGLVISYNASSQTSSIYENGSGTLNIGADASVNISNTGLNEFKARFITDGAVELYYDNAKKFETTATGVSITGAISAGAWNGTAIGVAYGGTGLTATPANGEIPIGNGSGYVLATITGGAGLTTTNGAGSITIDLDDTAVSPASYGSASKVGTFTVDQQGRLTAAADVNISIPYTQVSNFDTGVRTNRLDQMAAPTASVSFNSQKITSLADPTNAQDAATKNYVDNVAQGLDVKASCVVATTTNITLSGAQTIDGVSVVAGDRVLVKNQSTASQNGIYVVAAGAWARSSDTNTYEELVSAFVFVEEGTDNADNGYVCTVDAGGTLGSTAITWEQFSGAGQITAGNGLTKTGNTIDVVGTANRISVGADSIDIASTYVGQTSITTLGTVATGTWNATAIGLTYGGTGTNNTNITDGTAFLGPAYVDGSSPGNASFREILTSDIAPVTGGSFDAGTY